MITTYTVDDNLLKECKHAIKELQATTRRKFGGSNDENSKSIQMPLLLLCVRSEKNNKKLLNLGMNDEVVQNISVTTGLTTPYRLLIVQFVYLFQIYNLFDMYVYLPVSR
jgi:hypothetical protein